jgi:hypothetical protein
MPSTEKTLSEPVLPLHTRDADPAEGDAVTRLAAGCTVERPLEAAAVFIPQAQDGCMALPRPPTRLQLAATRGMQAAIVAILLAGVATGNVSVFVNASVALAITFLPAVLQRDWGIHLDPWLTLWITTAVLLHAVGMLGPYSTVDWWDHVTHTLSATIVAGVGYATARAIDEHSEAIHLPESFLTVFILLFTMALGVTWEILEFLAREVAHLLGVQAVLVQYGLGDTLVDLMFNTAGAILVALFGTDMFSSVVESLVDRFEQRRAH